MLLLEEIRMAISAIEKMRMATVLKRDGDVQLLAGAQSTCHGCDLEVGCTRDLSGSHLEDRGATLARRQRRSHLLSVQQAGFWRF